MIIIKTTQHLKQFNLLHFFSNSSRKKGILDMLVG